MICNVTETTRMRAPEISDPPDSTFPHQTAIALLERLNRLEPEARATALVALPWDAATVVGLRPVMARRDIDLATALGVFFRGAPERFNYMHKHEVPAAHLAEVRLLDNICQRVNSGFYLPQPGRSLVCRDRLTRWLAAQEADRAARRRGRWILDPAIVAAARDAVACPAPELPRPAPRKGGLWQALVAPVRGLGPMRRRDG